MLTLLNGHLTTLTHGNCCLRVISGIRLDDKGKQRLKDKTLQLECSTRWGWNTVNLDTVGNQYYYFRPHYDYATCLSQNVLPSASSYCLMANKQNHEEVALWCRRWDQRSRGRDLSLLNLSLRDLAAKYPLLSSSACWWNNHLEKKTKVAKN